MIPAVFGAVSLELVARASWRLSPSVSTMMLLAAIFAIIGVTFAVLLAFAVVDAL